MLAALLLVAALFVLAADILYADPTWPQVVIDGQVIHPEDLGRPIPGTNQ